ncbi:MAG: 50S ribosomal protein L9 [Bacilli bacterium]|nr:50S ribosomal protein L9 [Bacilli bacterium]
MKVILLQDVKKQGKKDQIINVSDGYATNFLIAQGLAVPYNEKNKNQLEGSIKRREEAEEQLIEDMTKLKKELEKTHIKFKTKTGKDGRMFGTITNKQISDELKKQNYNIDKRKISCDHTIESLGTHIVNIELHKKVIAKISITVE